VHQRRRGRFKVGASAALLVLTLLPSHICFQSDSTPAWPVLPMACLAAGSSLSIRALMLVHQAARRSDCGRRDRRPGSTPRTQWLRIQRSAVLRQRCCGIQPVRTVVAIRRSTLRTNRPARDPQDSAGQPRRSPTPTIRASTAWAFELQSSIPGYDLTQSGPCRQTWTRVSA